MRPEITDSYHFCVSSVVGGSSRPKGPSVCGDFGEFLISWEAIKLHCFFWQGLAPLLLMSLSFGFLFAVWSELGMMNIHEKN